jgi:hypothetical protein
MKAGIIILINDDSSLIRNEKTHEVEVRALKVMNDIKSISDLKYHGIIYTNGTNEISLDVTWSYEEIEFFSEQFRKINNVLHVFCLLNPIYELKEAEKLHDYFKVLAYSSTLIELYGKEMLNLHLKSTGIKEVNEIQDLHFGEVIDNIHGQGLIDDDLSDEIKDIKDQRNEFIHPLIVKNNITYANIQRIEELSSKAIEVVSKLIDIYKNLSSK